MLILSACAICPCIVLLPVLCVSQRRPFAACAILTGVLLCRQSMVCSYVLLRQRWVYSHEVLDYKI